MLIILAHNVKKNSVKAQLYNYILLIIYIIIILSLQNLPYNNPNMI